MQKNKTGNIKWVTDFVDEPLSLEAKDFIEEIRVIQKDADYIKLKHRGEAVTILILIWSKE